MPDRADSDGDESDSDHDGADTGRSDSSSPGAETSPAVTALSDDLPAPDSLAVDLPEPESLAVDLPAPDDRPPALAVSTRDALASSGAVPESFMADLRQAQAAVAEFEATVESLRNPSWARELQATSQQLAAMVRTMPSPPVVSPSPAIREFQAAAQTVAARQSEFSVAVRASMAAPAALAGLAAVTEPTVPVSPAVDPALFASVIGPELQETAAAINAIGPVVNAALPSVEPLRAAVRQPAFQQLVELIESLATMPVPTPAAVIDEQVLQQATLVAEQVDAVANSGGVAAGGGEPVGTTGGQAPEASPQPGVTSPHGFWSPAQPAEPAPGGQAAGQDVTQWTRTQLSAHSAEVRVAVAGGAAGVGLHHLSQLYPSHQATIGYVEPIVGAIVTIAVAVALNES